MDIPPWEVLERDGESGKRTLPLASKFTETPGCDVGCWVWTAARAWAAAGQLLLRLSF